MNLGLMVSGRAVVFGRVMVRFRLFASDMYIKDPQGQFVLKKES